MTKSVPSMCSPRPASVASYQGSPPRLSSPLNPSPNSFSPHLPTGHTPHNSPVGEKSDTLSPLREHPDLGLTSPPRSSHAFARTRTSSFSRSPRSATPPGRSPVVGPIPFQSHLVYTNHPSASCSPFAQGIPFPSTSPLSSSPLASLSQSPVSNSPRQLSPSNSPRPCSPPSTQSLQSRRLYAPTNLIKPHSHIHQGSPVQIMSPSSCFPPTQSLIQRSSGNQYSTQATSSPSDSPSRRVSLGVDTRPHTFPCANPMPCGHSFTQDTSTIVKGDSTPLDEAPIRWWGGRRGWLDDWENAALQSQGSCDHCTAPFPAPSELDGVMSNGFIQPTYGNPMVPQGLFGRCRGGPGAFLDEEIHASFSGVGGVGAGFIDPLSPGFFHAPTCIIPGYEIEGSPVPRALPMPMPPGVTAPKRNASGYVEVNVGAPPVDGGFAIKRTPDSNSAHPRSCHLHGDPGGSTPDGLTSVQDQGLRYGERGQTHIGRDRRFSNASTRSSTSYLSCLSGPSQSHSQSLVISSSPSHTSICPSLYSLGIGIEESEREERRSRSFWKRRSSGSTLKRQNKELSHDTSGHSEDVGQGCRYSLLVQSREKGAHSREGDNTDDRDVMVHREDLRQSVTHTREKDVAKHGSIFARVGSRHVASSDEQAQQAGYSRAEKWVSLAITSILPAATIAMLSPIGEALIKATESVSFVGHEIGPVVKDTLSVSATLLAFSPIPGIEEAAKALLMVWDACQKVDTNRLSCLRLAERCATLLYSVLCDIKETGTENALDEPVERLCSALAQVRWFLDAQLHRPFLKRYVRREEIARELQACNDAITDAASRFGMSVQIRTYQQVWTAAIESRRFQQEAHALLSLDHQIIQSQFATMRQQVQTCPEEVVTKSSNECALTLTANSVPVIENGRVDGAVGEGGNEDGGGYLIPPPAYAPQAQPLAAKAGTVSIMETPTPNGFGPGYGRGTPTLSVPSGNLPDATSSTLFAPLTLTPTKATFAVEKANTRTTITTMESMVTYPSLPTVIHALKDVHRAQDSVDAAEDNAALQGTLVGALDARSDVEMVRCLQVGREEIPEAAETLRRMLDAKGMEVDGNEPVLLERGEHSVDMKNTELDRRFMKSGIEAMMRLTTAVAKQFLGEGEEGHGKGTGAVHVSELPSWTITRYEVIRTRKIGIGSLSDVYLGHWRKLTVVVKVLAHSVSREAFVRHVELWNVLDHPHVLPLYGASSTVGEKPWFLVSKFCSGNNLVVSLKRAKVTGDLVVGDKATVRVDLLRFMQEIAKGMAYLHGCGVQHGELRAANVLVDEIGQCVLSDFGQREIRSEAHQPCERHEQHHIRWRAPEMLMGDDRLTNAADVYAFAICCIEILGMGDLPWATLGDKAVRELVMDKDERPPIPVLVEYGDIADALASFVRSCWVREPDRRLPFSKISASLEELRTLRGHGAPKICSSLSSINIGLAPAGSTESSPADEHYESASESMRTEMEDESVDCLMDVSLTSPVSTLGNGDRSKPHVSVSTHPESPKVSTRVTSGIAKDQDNNTPTPSPTTRSDVDTRNEEIYRLIATSNHVFRNSREPVLPEEYEVLSKMFRSAVTLPLWSPTRVELGAVGYLSKPKGEFITLFNAMDPLQSCDERLRRLPSMYGYGRLEVQKREEGKRSIAQRGLDAVSGFLTFKMRGDRSHPERVARQYSFPLVQGKPSAHLCVERTVYQYLDHLEAPTTWFKQHANFILEVCAPRNAIQREDLILVVGTLDALDWAVFVSDDHIDGRAQFSVFAGREKGEPWGMYTVEPAAKNGSTGPGRCVEGAFASKVSCVSGHDVAGDTVTLAGLRFEQGMQTPTMM